MSAKMYELREILCEELDKIADRGELSTGELDTAHKLTDTIKNIDKICMMEEGEGGYSQDGEWNAMGTYGRGNSYRNQRRDSMGRYSRGMQGGRMYSRNNYSMAGEIEGIEMQLKEMMDSGSLTASQKSAYKKALDLIKDA